MMDRCKTHHHHIMKLISGEISPHEQKELQDHAAGCPVCSALLNTDKMLAEMTNPIETPAQEAFISMRQSVLRQIRNRRRPKNAFSLTEWISDRKRGFSWQYAVATLLIFFSGFLTHLFLAGTEPTPQAEAALVDHIEQTAVYHTSLEQTQDSPYRFTDLQVERLNEDQLALSFTVSRHLKLIRQKDDPIISEILAQAIINQNATAARISFLDHTTAQGDPRIKEALLIALRTDPSAAVRLKALERLQTYPIDDDIRETLLQVLQADKSVSVRLIAIDYLTGQNIEKELIGETLGSQQEGKYAAIRQKALQYIRY